MIGSRIVSRQRCLWKSMSAVFLGRRKATYSAKNIEAVSLGSGVQIEWSDGEKSRFHSSWLRFCCKCEKCRQANSGQRTIDPLSLPDLLKLSNVSVSKNQQHLVLNWENEENHEGVIDLQWLREHAYTEGNLKMQSQQRTTEPFLGKQDSLPEVEFVDVMDSKEGLWKLLTQLSDHGISLIRNVPVDDEQNVIHVGKRIGPIQTTIYGETFRVLSVPNPINIAYSSARLNYHMDLMYYESPPGLQLLHCMRFDPEVEGGESLFVDAFHVAEELRTHYPEDFDNLVRIPATFQKIHFDRDYPVKLVYKRPHIVLNPDKQKLDVWTRGILQLLPNLFSEIQVVAVNWSPPFEGPLSVPEEDVEPYFKAYRILTRLVEESPIQKIVQMRPGDLVCFNNRRMAHGRYAFNLNGGTRLLTGTYVNIDEFRNTFQVMSEMTGTGQPCKRIGNQCLF